MSSASFLEEWLRTMGFDGEIPENLGNICNPSTSFIWDQLMCKVKPKQEIQLIKKNLIINRMQKSSSEQQDTYPIKEIEIYKKKQKLRKKIEILENEIMEKENILDNLLNSNKITYVSVQHIKEIIKENNQKTFLCEQKAVLLQKEISLAQERLRTLRNFTPVEEEQSENDIKETLKNCAEKLKSAINKDTRLTQQLTNSSCTRFTPQLNSTRFLTNSLLNDNCLVSTKLQFNTSEGNKYCKTTPRFSNNKENRNLPNSKRGQFYLEDCTEEDLLISNLNVTKKSTEKKPKRESLGLLLPGCIDELTEVDEEFLTSSVSKRDFSPILKEKKVTKFSCLDDDEVFLSSTLRRGEVFPLTSSLMSNTINESTSAEENIEDISKNKEANELLRNCLNSTNRGQIIKICKLINENIISETKKTILDYHSINSNKFLTNQRQENLSGLYFVHVKNELETIKHKAIGMELQKNVAERKSHILEELFKISSLNNLRDENTLLLELRMEDSQLDAALKFLKRINIELKSESNFVNDAVLSQIKKTNEDIMLKVDQIENCLTNISKIFVSIKNISEQALSSVRGLSQFIHDIYWAKPLQEQLFSNEIKIFERFPLHFNRKQQSNNTKFPTTNVVPSYINLDSNELSMLSTIIDLPFSPSESVILNILHLKHKLTKLESLQPPSKDLDLTNTSVAALLLNGEPHVEFIEKYQQFLNSENVKMITSSPNIIKNNMDQWLEVPVRGFIPKCVLIEEHNYNYYENIIKRLTFEF